MPRRRRRTPRPPCEIAVARAVPRRGAAPSGGARRRPRRATSSGRASSWRSSPRSSTCRRASAPSCCCATCSASPPRRSRRCSRLARGRLQRAAARARRRRGAGAGAQPAGDDARRSATRGCASSRSATSPPGRPPTSAGWSRCSPRTRRSRCRRCRSGSAAAAAIGEFLRTGPLARGPRWRLTPARAQRAARLRLHPAGRRGPTRSTSSTLDEAGRIAGITAFLAAARRSACARAMDGRPRPDLEGHDHADRPGPPPRFARVVHDGARHARRHHRADDHPARPRRLRRAARVDGQRLQPLVRRAAHDGRGARRPARPAADVRARASSLRHRLGRVRARAVGRLADRRAGAPGRRRRARHDARPRARRAPRSRPSAAAARWASSSP